MPRAHRARPARLARKARKARKALPVLTASGWVSVGLYAGDLHTSRAARLLALSSVLTPGGSPAAPAEGVYAQIMAKLNELSTVSPEDIAKAVADYLAAHPIKAIAG